MRTARLASNYNGTGKHWYQGDFTYNGTVNVQDFNLLAANYNGTWYDDLDPLTFGNGEGEENYTYEQLWQMLMNWGT